MTAKAFVPLPAPGDIVWCRFPEDERLGKPGPKPRPALVVGIDAHEGAVNVAYGTSQNVEEFHSGEFLISPNDGPAFALSGLSMATKFDLNRLHVLPYDRLWFGVPPSPQHGQTPKLGTLHPSLMRRAEAAYRAATSDDHR
ncbi:MAG: type II toxin-antitoxin system PemK/MazF family toxin [Betaproteobacteria bacterium]